MGAPLKDERQAGAEQTHVEVWAISPVDLFFFSGT